MSFWPDLTLRSNQAEMMDSLDGDQQQLFKTLRQFRWINRLLTPCHRLIKRHFLSAMLQDLNRTWSLLDIGAGGCDLGIWIAKWGQKHNIDIAITCLDHDPRTVQFATAHCANWANITVRQADANQLADCGETWDFVFTNHFLHHLTDTEIVSVLRAVAAVTKETFVVSDIHRTRATYLLFSALLPLRLTDSFVWHDGRLSIRKGFTVAELDQLLDAAGLTDRATIQRHLPGHLSISSR